jgi:anti-sigma B factor antagonist
MTTSPKGLTIDDAVEGDRRTISVRGELDLSTSPELTSVLEGAGGGDIRTITLDLHGVGFIDSSALRALVVSGRDLAAAGCRLEIGPRSEMVARVLTMTSLDEGNDAFTVLPEQG